MWKLLVLLVAAAFADDGNYDYEESRERHIILKNTRKCVMARNIREQIDRHHNYLRQQVARGKSYMGRDFEGRQMTGLVYDCALEEEAQKEQENPGSAPNKYGKVKITWEYKRGMINDLQTALEATTADDDKLRQMINQKTTRFGCWGYLGRIPPKNIRGGQLVCIYDKKGRRKDKIIEGEYCYDGDEYYGYSNCTIVENAVCKWNLCYVL
ncbi:hypothetical protein RB195_007549 [Necator americanus]|uniref:SCP domain-containing protein n=1 Tax=Necator americanus TaxID=51031 RepID=A0ABR1C094_NECAM